MLSTPQRYKLNKGRKNMLQFMVQMQRQKSRYRYVMNEAGECHLNNCWAPCHCHRIEAFGEIPKTLDCKILSFHPWGPPVEQPVSQTTDESFQLFFQRLQDPTHLIQWYEDYCIKTQALYFQGVVRKRKIAHIIDVQYHPFLKEWHLTNCERWNDETRQSDPDTCHCWNALENPFQYLENYYNILDEQLMIPKEIYPYQKFMQDYTHRFDSFPAAIAVELAVEAGFFWLGDSAVQCAFCPIHLEWTKQEPDNFLKLHIQLNPKCPYLIKSLDLPFHMKHGRTFPDIQTILWKMYDYSQRLATFEKQKNGSLAAAAGFFYAGGDTVQCPFCELVLKDWKNPLQDHMKLKPHCPYLKNFPST